jgi:hypothetical protein
MLYITPQLETERLSIPVIVLCMWSVHLVWSVSRTVVLDLIFVQNASAGMIVT